MSKFARVTGNRWVPRGLQGRLPTYINPSAIRYGFLSDEPNGEASIYLHFIGEQNPMALRFDSIEEAQKAEREIFGEFQ